MRSSNVGCVLNCQLIYCLFPIIFICQFYLDDLEDELTTMALQMLVKDLLILFQAGNEGVINVLGMSTASFYICPV
jgi:phosphatidylinositol-binding clathrin assembly protein